MLKKMNLSKENFFDSKKRKDSIVFVDRSKKSNEISQKRRKLRAERLKKGNERTNWVRNIKREWKNEKDMANQIIHHFRGVEVSSSRRGKRFIFLPIPTMPRRRRKQRLKKKFPNSISDILSSKVHSFKSWWPREQQSIQSFLKRKKFRFLLFFFHL